MNDPRVSRTAWRKMQRHFRQPRPCLLCGNPPTCAGVFVPNTPETWGGQPGKRRVIGYCLCARCFALPDKTWRVEARLQADMVGARN